MIGVKSEIGANDSDDQFHNGDRKSNGYRESESEITIHDSVVMCVSKRILFFYKKDLWQKII